MLTHTRRVKIAYLLAAIPAGFLPLSYVILAVWVFAVLSPDLLRGTHVDGPGRLVMWTILAGYYATLIQWPFYILWAALTRTLTFRMRVLWIGVLVFFNMFAMPWFLFCMFRGTAQTVLIRGIRRKSVRRYFEKGMEPETPVA